MSRQGTPEATQTQVFFASRRRCCICFGLNRDSERKRGQIAHLDRNPSNNELDNLAYLCLDHHEEYDSRTSQSKGMTTAEVKQYRGELYGHFADWSQMITRRHLLSFIASRISVEDIAQAVVDVASTVYFYGPRHAHDVLTWPELKSDDPETTLNHLVVLDSCASWGLLTFREEDIQDEEGLQYTLLTVNHFPICRQLAEVIARWIAVRGETNWPRNTE